MSWQPLLQKCIDIAIQAGDAIELSAKSLQVNQKNDNSPVTNADLAADKIIQQGLTALKDLGHPYPILSEESYESFKITEGRYWCVDPLDGTRDFIHNTGDYTVNIALMENHQPVLGVVHAPHSNVTYYASPDGAFKLQDKQVIPLGVKQPQGQHLTALISRFHPNEDLVKCLQNMPEIELMQRGSAIKLCAIAEGSADIYPRLTPCHDWDIAAAHCVLKAAGGEIFTMQLEPFKYNHETPWLLRGLFAVNDPTRDWHQLMSKLPKSN